MNFYTHYNPPPKVVVEFLKPSKTRQDAKNECDINYVIARVGAGVTSLVPPSSVFVDISDVPSDYTDLQNRLHDADDRFNSLPSKLRSRFGNSPAALFAFLSDSRNREEAVKLGLLKSVDVVKVEPAVVQQDDVK